MKYALLITCYLLLTTLFTACIKTNIPAQDQLPPITQTGANTFGCLINGEVYTPQGFEQNKPAFDMMVDPTFQNGHFGILTYNKKKKMRLIFASNDIKNQGLFTTLVENNTLGCDYYDDFRLCNFSPNSMCTNPFDNCLMRGTINITRYDLINKIFSGTFEFTLFDPATSCDTIRITQGRFDKKLN